MPKRDLKLSPGYNLKTQSRIGLFAAQLDDQLRRLRKHVKSLTVPQLEWQLRPGMNTVGMLLAHLALVEVWWITVAPQGLSWEPDGKKIVKKVCGFDDDGLPAPADAPHVDYLQGYTIEKYLSVLAKMRRITHRELRSWRDRDLDKVFGPGKWQISRLWSLYHVLEHFAGHYGQILLLKHLMRDAGVLSETDTS